MRKYKYTADDEYPDCGRCNHINDSEDLCVKWCGAEHGWSRYERTEYVKEQEDLRRVCTEIHF